MDTLLSGFKALLSDETTVQDSSWGQRSQNSNAASGGATAGIKAASLAPSCEELLASLSNPLESSIDKRVTMAFQNMYQHLNEEHYLDRLVNALYTKSRKRGVVSSDHIIFENRIRARFPSSEKLGAAIETALNDHLNLVHGILTSSIARFRMCALAHLFESALGLQYDTTVNGISPRVLEPEERTFVFRKIQHIFLDLFEQTDVQTSLRALLHQIYETDVSDETKLNRKSTPSTLTVRTTNDTTAPRAANTMANGNGAPSTRAKLNAVAYLLGRVHPLVKEMLPCIDSLIQEYQNISNVSGGDNNVKAELHSLYNFVMLSLGDMSFVQAYDYVTTARTVVDNLKKSLEQPQCKGPAERLVKTIVGLAEQLWNGGMRTETSIAIEQVMVAVVHGSADERDVGGAQEIFSREWDFIRSFEAVLAVMDSTMAPVPLPSLVVGRKHWEVTFDSILLQFPDLLSGNVHLSPEIGYDRANKTKYRQWHLKIHSIEIEAKNVAYCLKKRKKSSILSTDVGEVNLTIPNGSLNIDVVFTITTPQLNTAVFQTITKPAMKKSESVNTQLGANGGGRRSSKDNGKRMAADSKSIYSVKFSTTATDAQQRARENHEVETSAYQRLVEESELKDTWELAPNERISVGRPKPQYAFTSLARVPSQASTFDGSKGQPARAVETQRKISIGDYITINECKVQLSTVSMDVLSSKHPFLETLAHSYISRQLRKGMEHAIVKAIHKAIDAINESVVLIIERDMKKVQSQGDVPRAQPLSAGQHDTPKTGTSMSNTAQWEL
ncbi:hypothetical protein BG004_003761 [Podila humilis]|nr:hypothetical protein BG004_003761 [Podila humilis]